MEIEYHITIEGWPELADRLRTACAHGLVNAFEATIYRVDRRVGDWMRGESE